MKLSRLKCAVMNFPKNMLCLQGFHCFIIGLLRHCSVLIFVCLFLCFLRHYTISSMFLLFHYLFVTSPYHLFKISIASSFCLLRHCSVLCFDCLFLCFSRHYSISSRFPLFHYLFVTSLLYSRFSWSIFLCILCYVTRLSLQGFYCVIICLLRKCSVLAFDCPFLCLLRVTFYSGYFYVFILSFQGFRCFIIFLLHR